MSTMEPPTNEEKNLLNEFRERLLDLELTGEENGDYYLLRWLRARDLNLGKADEMLRNSIDWRKRNQVDTILTEWNPPVEILKNYPFEIIGFDKNSSPICVLPFGKWDVKKLVAEHGKSMYVKYNDYLHETVMKVMKEKRESDGVHVWQYITIFDLEGFSIRQMTAMGTVDAILETVRTFEANYPETLLKAYAINAPRAFTILFAMIKPLLTQRTLNKVEIHGVNANKWKKALLAKIPASELPPAYGGNNTSIKNKNIFEEKDSSNEIDKSISEEDSNLIAVTIEAGEKLEIAYDIQQPDTTINWEFRTDDFDVGFSIFEGSNEILPYQRTDSHEMKQNGSFVCTKPGRYTMVFDNTYSRLRSKTIYYMVTMSCPDFDDEDEITTL